MQQGSILEILNSGGAVIFTEKISSDISDQGKSFDFRYLAKGIYFVKLNVDNKIYSEKLVIR
nr:T9SS type A sorting domain-containing protein [Bacteroidota bacterium]